ncbi:hypothetical protein VB712_18150 [Spirulina sp. CCNP1310]|uniref:hypothetical protein n=1 Tax=Spirulina sp. CCNP1310 TaxID=3110249 RepID=UPI002B21EEE6|nr:hypothetical protein [Spirulina sp. CCNP1310]MEA5421152.1 hypothetical protein [Spirulina sp. CCNP1310]
MALQRRLLVSAGSLLISSLCPVLAPAGSILTEDGVKALLGVINAVAGGNAASALDKLLDSGDDGRLLENRHLTKAVGKAIAVVILAKAKSYRGETQDALKKLAKHAEQNWVNLAQQDDTREDYPALMEQNLADVITPTDHHLTQKTCLTIPLWRDICEKLYGQIPNHPSISDEVLGEVAKELHTVFPKALREVLKRDFAQKGEAFAGLSLNLLTEMRKELDKLKEFQEQDITIILNHFEKVEEGLKDIKKYQQFDSQFQKKVLQDLGVIEVSTDQILDELSKMQASLDRIEVKIQATYDKTQSTYDLVKSEALPQKIWRCLLKFDYQTQQSEFDRFLENPIGACLILGQARSAQPLLVHRFLSQKYYFKQSFLKKINCAALSQGSCLKKLVCGQLGLERNASIDKIFATIIKRLETQSVIFIVKDIHATTSEAIEEFMLNFWQPLVNFYDERCQKLQSKNKLVFIFVALEEASDVWQMTYRSQPTLSRRSQLPHELYPLTKIEYLSSDNLRDHLYQFMHDLTQEGVPEEDSQRVLHILEDEGLDLQAQEDLFRYICEECYPFKWTDFERRWQHHYS